MTYFGSPDDMVIKVNQWCSENIEKYKAESIFIPAGKTPEPLYKNWESVRPKWLEKLELLQVDDVHTGAQKGMFKVFFNDNLPSYSERIKTPVQSGGQNADLAILGFGQNGHVAFHEPGLPESFYYGVIDLSEQTRSHLKLEDDAKGVTYGVGAFLQAKAILLIVAGSGKQRAFQKFQAGDTDIPAGFLAQHPDLTVLVDSQISLTQNLSGAKKAIFAAPRSPASSGI